jgi:hypothetical protein
MSKFSFTTDSQSEQFCIEIADEMVKTFGISGEEAIGRINRHWKGLVLVGPYDLIYHEGKKYWANTIYYGHDSFWWLNTRVWTKLV